MSNGNSRFPSEYPTVGHYEIKFMVSTCLYEPHKKLKVNLDRNGTIKLMSLSFLPPGGGVL